MNKVIGDFAVTENAIFKQKYHEERYYRSSTNAAQNKILRKTTLAKRDIDGRLVDGEGSVFSGNGYLLQPKNRQNSPSTLVDQLVMSNARREQFPIVALS